MQNRRSFIKATAVSLAFAAAGFISAPAIAADTVIGLLRQLTVLHEGSAFAEGDLATVQNDERVIEVYLRR